MEDQPLIPTTTTTAITTPPDNNDDENSGLILSWLLIILIGLLALWANHESIDKFQITILNDAKGTRAGRRFTHMYLSNDKATRIVLNTSHFAENLLYDSNDHHLIKKQINHVTLRLASRNMTHAVTVDDGGPEKKFVMHVSLSIMGEMSNVDYAMVSAVQRGMARIWLWDGGAPPVVLNGIVEYIAIMAGFGGGNGKLPESDNACWADKDPVNVAHFFDYCERHKRGFIRRLNKAMQYGWHERTVDDALGMPAQYLCASYNYTNIPNKNE